MTPPGSAGLGQAGFQRCATGSAASAAPKPRPMKGQVMEPVANCPRSPPKPNRTQSRAVDLRPRPEHGRRRPAQGHRRRRRPRSPCATRKCSTRTARSTPPTSAARRPSTPTSARAAASEIWQPQFTFHGFRYVEVTGYPGKPALDAVTGIVIALRHAADRRPSTCSDAMVNQLQSEHRLGPARQLPRACPPTARSATSGSAGWATPRSSSAPPPTTSTSPRSSPSGWRDVNDGQDAGRRFTDVAPVRRA